MTAEASLEEIVSLNQQQVALLNKIAGGPSGGGAVGGGAGSGAGGSIGLLGKTASMAGGLIGGVFTGAIKIASAGFNTLTDTSKTLWQNQKTLSAGFIEGNNSLSNLTAGLEKLPFGLGLVAQAMNYQTRVVEKNIQSFQTISTAGVTLGGNLDQVRRSAASMYLSMDEFANLMKTSGPILRYLGTTSDEGAKNLIKFNSTLIKGEVGKGLLSMGFTLEQVNGMLGSYASVVGGIKEADIKDQKRMEQSVLSFSNELDLAAQLEGKTRQQKEQELKKAAQQAAVEEKLAGMTQDQKDKYAIALAAAQREGQGAVDALHSAMLGFPPMTKAAQLYTAVNSEAAQAMERNADIVNDNSTVVEARTKIDKNSAEATAATAKAYEQGGKSFQAVTFSNGDLAGTIQGMARSSADTKNKNIKSEQDAENRIKGIRDAQATAQKGQVGAIVQAQGAAKHAGGLMEQLSAILKPLFPVITWLTEGFVKIATSAANFGKDIMDKLLIPMFKDLFGNLKVDDLLKPFKDFWKGLTGGFTSGDINLTAIKDTIVKFVKPFVTMFGDFVNSINFEEIGKTVRGFIKIVYDTFSGIINSIDFEEVGKTIKRVILPIYEMFSGIVKSINFEEIGKFVKEFFITSYKLFTTFINSIDFEAIKNTVLTYFEKIKGFFIGLFGAFDLEGLKGDASGILKNIGEGLNWIVKILGDVAKTIDFKGIGERFGKSLVIVWDAIKAILEPILIKGAEIFKKIGDDLGPIFKDLSDITTILLEHFMTIVDGIMMYVWPLMKPVVDGILNAILPFWDAFKNFIKMIKAVLTGDFETYGKMWEEMWTNIFAGIGAFMDGIWGSIKKIFSRATGQEQSESWKPATPAPTSKAEADKNKSVPTKEQIAESQRKEGLENEARKAEKRARELTAGTTASAAAEAQKTEAARAAMIAEREAEERKRKELLQKQAEKEAKERERQAAETKAPVVAKTADPMENLRLQLETLNKQTADILRSIRETSENTRRTVEATKSLNKNVFQG